MKYFLIPFVCIPYLLIGQTKLPDVIKPSPQAGEMVKYIDYPMDLSSGLPSTSIPIYNVTSGSINLPISISYHASGFKPNEDESGVIGLGWNLNAFGMISRSINKNPDENYWNTIIPLKENIHGTQTNLLVEDADVALLNGIAQYGTDTSPDIFSYSLPNSEGGKFVYGRNTVLSEFKKAVLLPYKPVKVISYPPDTSNLDYYEIIDENGTTYRFGKSISSGQIVREYFRDFSSSNQQGNGITSWSLTEIISANKKDTLYFEYDDVIGKLNSNFIDKYNIQFSTNVSLLTCHEGQCPGNSNIQDQIQYNYNAYSQKKITKITFNSGYVKFSYKSNLYPDHLLDKIEIFSNGATNPLKIIKFNQTKYQNASTSTSAKYWYKLDEVGFYDSGNVKVNKYNFEYNSANFPFIDTSTNPTSAWLVNTSSIDFWGFYNGASNTNLLPSNYTWTGMWGTTNLFGNADRSANYFFAQRGYSKKIIFPTGGERSFEYEGNKNVNGEFVGGLRVKSISNKSGEKEIKRTFTYAGSSRPLNSLYFKKHSMSTVKIPFQYAYSTNDFTASSAPNTDININGRSIIYSKVIEYDGDEIINNGRIEHVFDTSILQIYPKFYLRSLSVPFSPWNFSFYSIPLSLYYYDVIFGNILEKETNFYNDKGDLVKIVKNNYSHTLKQNLKGFYCSALINYGASYNYKKSGAFNFYNYDIQQLSQKLDSTETTNYLGGNVLTSKEEYTYNDNLFVTKKTSDASDGGILISQYKYPTDFATQIPYTQMVNKNIIAPVIEETQSKATRPLSSTKNIYKDWGNDNILPEFIQSAKGTNSLEDRIQYQSYYISGNIKEVSLKDNTHIVYIWGYNNQYPIAKIENSTSAQVSGALGISDLNTVNETYLTAINNLRTSLPNAMVSTYTYLPLVGLSTVTDPKNDTTTYNYDNFGRLRFVKDKDGNILSENQYNYKQ